MLKKTLFVLVMVLLAGANLLYAEGQKEQGTAGGVVLNVLNYGDITTPEGQAWLEIKAAFLKKYPNISLKDESLFDESYHQKLQALVATGNVPDVVYMWPSGDRLKVLMDAKLVNDQKRFIDPKQFLDNAMTGFGPKGELWTIPIGVGAHHVMYANKALLSKLGLAVPKTYDELVKQVKTIKDAKLTPVAMANADTWVMGTCLFSTFLGRFGGPNWLSNVYTGKTKFNDEVGLKSLQMVEQLYKDGVLSKESLQTDYATALSIFVNSEAVYLIDGGWRANSFDAAFAANITWAAFPALPGEKFPGAINGGITPGYTITAPVEKDPKKLEAAKTLLQFVTGEEASLIRAKVQGVLPAYKVKGTIVYKAGSEMQGSFLKSAKYLTLTMDNLITGEPVNLTNTFLQQIGLGTKTPVDAANEIEKALAKNR